VKKSNQTQFRELLRLHSDGMTATELSNSSGTRKDSTLASLKCMPDAYIDRWTSVSGKFAGVWCVVVPPENCPKPERNKNV
jgi:hypothetical protein